MSKFAYFNPHDGRVLQWIDTEAMEYNMPEASMLHECTDAEWDMRDVESMIQNGMVVPFVARSIDVAAADWHAYQSSACAVLAASDTTLMRCYESGIALPAEWVEYRKALRAIISAKSGDPTQPLPTRPDYPKGT